MNSETMRPYVDIIRWIFLGDDHFHESSFVDFGNTIDGYEQSLWVTEMPNRKNQE